MNSTFFFVERKNKKKKHRKSENGVLRAIVRVYIWGDLGKK